MLITVLSRLINRVKYITYVMSEASNVAVVQPGRDFSPWSGRRIHNLSRAAGDAVPDKRQEEGPAQRYRDWHPGIFGG